MRRLERRRCSEVGTPGKIPTYDLFLRRRTLAPPTLHVRSAPCGPYRERRRRAVLSARCPGRAWYPEPDTLRPCHPPRVAQESHMLPSRFQGPEAWLSNDFTLLGRLGLKTRKHSVNP